jgi:hypothetical protein
LKSDCSVLDSETILATSRLSAEECFRPFRVLTVPSGEEAAANSIRVNGKVLVPRGYPATAELLTGAGYTVALLPTSQPALLDGGLSCMSLRLTQPGPKAGDIRSMGQASPSSHRLEGPLPATKAPANRSRPHTKTGLSTRIALKVCA